MNDVDGATQAFAHGSGRHWSRLMRDPNALNGIRSLLGREEMERRKKVWTVMLHKKYLIFVSALLNISAGIPASSYDNPTSTPDNHCVYQGSTQYVA